MVSTASRANRYPSGSVVLSSGAHSAKTVVSVEILSALKDGDSIGSVYRSRLREERRDITFGGSCFIKVLRTR